MPECCSGSRVRDELAGNGAVYAEQLAAVWRGVFMRDRTKGPRYVRLVTERFYGVACSGSASSVGSEFGGFVMRIWRSVRHFAAIAVPAT